MTEPAFIVEGFLEKEFLRTCCPGRPIRRLELNGRNVRIEAIVDRIQTLVSLLGNRNHPIVVLFDREERKETSIEIARSVAAELAVRRVPGKFVIGVPDRMIENWILADAAVRKKLRIAEKKQSFDGQHGKALIKRSFSGPPYRETIDGVNLLRGALASSIAVRSASFKEFAKQLQLNCYWLMR